MQTCAVLGILLTESWLGNKVGVTDEEGCSVEGGDGKKSTTGNALGTKEGTEVTTGAVQTPRKQTPLAMLLQREPSARTV